MKVPNKKSKFIAASVFTLIGYVLLVVGVVYFFVGERENLESVIVALIVIIEVCMGISWLLNRSYRRRNKENGVKSGVFCTFVYVATIFAAAALFILPLIGYAIFCLFNFVVEKIGQMPGGGGSSQSDSKPDYEIRDEQGNSRTLSYDKYTKEYRDSTGGFWKTDDDGKTFHRIKK